MSCLVCTSEEEVLRRAQRIRSRAIDEQIRRDRDEHFMTHRLLLQGPAGSGKSTIMKQLRIMRGDVFNDKEKQMIMSDMKSNIREIITTIIKAMSFLSPPIALELPDNEVYVRYILEEASKPNYDYPEEFYDVCLKLWEDKGVMECYGCSNEYQLLDCAPYFMNVEKLQAVASSDPIMMVKTNKTMGIAEEKYTVGTVNFHIIDVSGIPNCHRHVWMERIFDGNYI